MTAAREDKNEPLEPLLPDVPLELPSATATPRTDKQIFDVKLGQWRSWDHHKIPSEGVSADFARQLERELAGARETLTIYECTNGGVGPYRLATPSSERDTSLLRAHVLGTRELPPTIEYIVGKPALQPEDLKRLDPYPNLQQMMRGCVSGSWTEWPRMRVELAALLLSTPSTERTPVGWVVAVREAGQMVVYGPQYHTREAADQDAALPNKRGQHAEVWTLYRDKPSAIATTGEKP